MTDSLDKNLDREWYTLEDVRRHRLLGDHSNRIDSFARRKYCKGPNPLLVLDEAGRISRESLLKLKERLNGQVKVTELSAALGVRQAKLWEEYGEILIKYVENIFPQTRKGYQPIYVLQEGCRLDDLLKELRIADSSAVKMDPEAKPEINERESVEITFLKNLAREIARILPYEIASGIEKRIADQTGYAGRRLITEDLYPKIIR